MEVKFDHDGKAPRSNLSQACFRRAPWNEKMALVMTVDEASWPACLFILTLLLKRIIKLEKQEDCRIMTSKASPHLKTFTGKSDDFRFHHYLDLVCGAGVGGVVATMLGHLRLPLEETVTRLTDILDSAPTDLLEQPSLRQKLSSQIHTKLHDKMEPTRLTPELRTCDSPQNVCQQNASPFLSVPGMCQTLVFGARKRTPSKVYVFRSYQHPVARELRSAFTRSLSGPVSLVNVCRITMASSKYHEYVNACLEAQRPTEHMVGVAGRIIDYPRLVADEIHLAHYDTCSLRYLLEIGNQPKKSSSARRFCWPFRQAQTCKEGLDIKPTKKLKNFEHLRIGNLNELAGFVRSGLTAAAEEYCSAQGLDDKLEDCARVLVESRRSRASTIEWEIFAFSDRYLCSICRKEGHDIGILDKPAFFDHVDFLHDFYDLEPPEMMEIQKQSRVVL